MHYKYSSVFWLQLRDQSDRIKGRVRAGWFIDKRIEKSIFPISFDLWFCNFIYAAVGVHGHRYRYKEQWTVLKSVQVNLPCEALSGSYVSRPFECSDPILVNIVTLTHVEGFHTCGRLGSVHEPNCTSVAVSELPHWLYNEKLFILTTKRWSQVNILGASFNEGMYYQINTEFFLYEEK